MTLRFGNNTIQRGPQPTATTVAPPLARGFIVGRLERGPVGRPVTIRDYEEFRSIFGAGTEANGTAELAEEARDYFRTVGNLSDAIVLRLYEGDAVAGTALEPAGAEAVKVNATANGPGTYGNNLQRAFVLSGTGDQQRLTVYAREMVGSLVVASRNTPPVEINESGIAQANDYLRGLLVLAWDATATTVANSTTAPGQPLNWISLAGGKDSGAITTATLSGSINDDTQVRTGLEVLKLSRMGGGALIAPGFETDEGRAIKYAWAAATWRFVPETPPTDLLISGGIADYEAARMITSAEFAGYWYPRARTIVAGRPTSRSGLGALAGLYVACIMRRPGYIAPMAGELVLKDTQRSPDGSVPLVTDANMAGLQAQGLNVLVARNRVEAQGLALLAPDPMQAATVKLHHRMVGNALAYELGPVLSQFNNTYVDAAGAFYTAVEGELKKRIRPYHESGVLYGLSLADAVQIKFGFEQTEAEAIEKVGRVKVDIVYKISGVSEGIDLSLGHVAINTVFG